MNKTYKTVYDFIFDKDTPKKYDKIPMEYSIAIWDNAQRMKINVEQFIERTKGYIANNNINTDDIKEIWNIAKNSLD